MIVAENNSMRKWRVITATFQIFTSTTTIFRISYCAESPWGMRAHPHECGYIAANDVARRGCHVQRVMIDAHNNGSSAAAYLCRQVISRCNGRDRISAPSDKLFARIGYMNLTSARFYPQIASRLSAAGLSFITAKLPT